MHSYTVLLKGGDTSIYRCQEGREPFALVNIHNVQTTTIPLFRGHVSLKIVNLLDFLLGIQQKKPVKTITDMIKMTKEYAHLLA